MGQAAAKTCPAIETLGCIECETCRTANDVCNPLKKTAIENHIREIKTDDTANKNKLNNLKHVRTALDTKYDNVVREANAAALAAKDASDTAAY